MYEYFWFALIRRLTGKAGPHVDRLFARHIFLPWKSLGAAFALMLSLEG
jgi:hypothetical protein